LSPDFFWWINKSLKILNANLNSKPFFFFFLPFSPGPDKGQNSLWCNLEYTKIPQASAALNYADAEGCALFQVLICNSLRGRKAFGE